MHQAYQAFRSVKYARARLRTAALIEERGDQAPERVLMQRWVAELATRQPWLEAGCRPQ